jgi:NTP pyrophosphatase (non-canonical NTP hydrolase)
MLQAGGYWRPLAAVARLLEELGELLELLEGPGRPAADLAGELADLWIITTALADQFRIDVAALQAVRRAPGGASVAGLVIAAGPIGRVVNYYDGPKTPRVPGELPSLAEAIGDFQAELGALSETLGVDLPAAVSDKLAAIGASADMRRFARETSDPSTAPVLAQLAPGRLWGAPLPLAPDAPAAAAALAPSLAAFTRAALPEGLAGYVIGAPAGLDSPELGAWVSDLLAELRLIDPAGAGGPVEPGAWGLSFNGLELAGEILPAVGPHPRPAALLLLRPVGGVLLGPADDPA